MDSTIFHKILCPVDFSDASTQGLRYAGAVAQCQDARLIVLHNFKFSPPPCFTKSQDEKWERRFQDCRNAARKSLNELITATLESQSREVEVRVINWFCAEGILNTAEQLQTDLIVMGTHGRRGIDRLMLGSMTESICRTAPIPVLGIRPGVSQTEVPPRHLLCAVNNTPLSAHLLKIAIRMAKCFEASLTVLHVLGPGQKFPIADLGAWILKEDRSQYPIQEMLRKGSVGKEIITAAIQSECHLVLIGAHHRQFHGTNVLGTDTKLVMRHGPCPVLVVPSEGID